ncbi:MAG: GNAT family N-acetyltransferase [Candidatus Micrarchaeota archaeon]
MLMITIRTVKPSEMDSAKDFIQSVFPDALVQIGDEDIILVAEYNTKLIGFAHVIEEEERILLQGLGVDQAMRGHGVGSFLLENILDLFGEFKPIYLKVKITNPAIDLYSRYGFFLKKFGERLLLVKKFNT